MLSTLVNLEDLRSLSKEERRREFEQKLDNIVLSGEKRVIYGAVSISLSI